MGAHHHFSDKMKIWLVLNSFGILALAMVFLMQPKFLLFNKINELKEDGKEYARELEAAYDYHIRDGHPITLETMITYTKSRIEIETKIYRKTKDLF